MVKREKQQNIVFESEKIVQYRGVGTQVTISCSEEFKAYLNLLPIKKPQAFNEESPCQQIYRTAEDKWTISDGPNTPGVCITYASACNNLTADKDWNTQKATEDCKTFLRIVLMAINAHQLNKLGCDEQNISAASPHF